MKQEERKWTPSQELAMQITGRSLLVSAAAGSGKTSVLTERIIRRLTDPEHPAKLSRMLVVTFTRAAAAELKGRIAEALTKALAKDPTNTALSEQLLALSSAQISTIDSFFQRLVRANFETLGIPAGFRVADEGEVRPIAEHIIDELVEEYYTRYASDINPEQPISAVENNAFARCLDHLMSDRSDGKLTQTLLSYPEQFSSYPEGIGLLSQCADELRHAAHTPFLQTKMGGKLKTYLLPILERCILDLNAFHDGWAHDPVSCAKCDGLWSTDLEFCKALKKALCEDDYGQAFTVVHAFIKGRFPSKFEKIAAVEEYQLWRDGFKNRVAAMQKKLGWSEEEIRLQSLETAELCEMLYRFYSEYRARFFAEKQSRGILEHNDVRELVYRLLSDKDGNASDLARELQSQYDAVYIDEYQDVDLLQDRIFALIGSDRRFMVGDIKQSIYGFRGSDPSIFAAYRRSMPLYGTPEAEGADGVGVFMSENFRCNRPVIDFANQVCSFLFSACEESVGYRPEDDLNCSKPEPANPPAPTTVAIFDMPPKGEEKEDTSADSAGTAEARWVAAEISRLLREEKKDNGSPILPSDIAILVRTRAHGVPFAEALERLNIPVSSESSDRFLRDPLLLDTLNLLRAIDNPFSDLPLSELLLSPIGGFSLEEISALRAASDQNAALFDALRHAAPETVSQELAEKASATVEWLTELGERASVLPADRFLRLLYLDERMIAYSGEPVLLFLYEEARTYQRTSWCGLYGFLLHIEKAIENEKISAGGFAKAKDAVTIMTIHHSKGLEFPVVFLSGCGGYFNRSDIYEKLLFHHGTGCACKLYQPQTGEHLPTALHEIVKQEIDLEQTEEGIRTLYVALTRARERLFVTGTLRSLRERAKANAAGVRRGDRAAILSCNSYLAWIMAALRQPLTETGKHFANVLYLEPAEVDEGVALRSTVLDSQRKERDASPEAIRYAEVCRRAATAPDPHATLRTLPTKAAASKLRADLLDRLTDETRSDDTLESQIELLRSAAPSFDEVLSKLDQPSATDIGTATHAFLQFCDFARLAKDGVDAECSRLVENRFIGETVARILHRDQLEAFRKSDLMTLILRAASVRREQKFGIFVPMATLTQNPALTDAVGDAPLFVQGSIDLLLEMSDGSLILVDYKTDRILDGERADEALLLRRMKERHGEQLACYREAVTRLFGKAPDRVLLYSLPLGRALAL